MLNSHISTMYKYFIRWAFNHNNISHCCASKIIVPKERYAAIRCAKCGKCCCSQQDVTDLWKQANQ